MKATSFKGKKEDNGNISVTKTKVSSKVFAANANAKQPISSKASQSAKNDQLPYALCKCQHPIWRCQSFKEKTPTQSAKIATENQLCFSCLNGKHSFRTCPRQQKCTIEGC